jgi:ATPase family associated with various cellular activities (AAA)
VTEHLDWQEQNRGFLAAALADLRRRLRASGALAPTAGEQAGGQPDGEDADPAVLASQMSRRPALLHLAGIFGLTDFERDLVLLCLGAEVGDQVLPPGSVVTVGRALEILAGAHWSAFDPGGTLRYWEIIRVDAAALLASAGLRLDPDVTAYLLGFTGFSGASDVFAPADRPAAVFPRQTEAASQLVVAAALAAERAGRAVIELAGAGDDERTALAAVIADTIGSGLGIADLRDLPPPGADLDRLLLRWARYARLSDVQLLVRAVAGEPWPDDPRLRRLLSGRLPLALVSTARPAVAVAGWPLIRHHAAPFSAGERLETWAAQLRAAGLDGVLDPKSDELTLLASQFKLGSAAIGGICAQARAVVVAGAGGQEGEPETVSPPDPARLAELLRDGCHGIVRAGLDPVAERVDVQDLQDLELPGAAREQFAALADHVRLHHHVTQQWGMGGHREPAPVALFAGPSGTGKTHAALVLARDLGLDLYRVNLATVLSKWIGETEQNLQAIFDAAAPGGVILLFDEADALFGKRSEVRDSHDRYANLSTSYLLQQVERAAVPMILTTNMKQALDPGFVRRLHFVIEFPFPEPAARERIWSSVFPPRVPVAELAPPRLAQLAVTGGTIRNIARRAAFMAAAQDKPVTMADLRDSARHEARKQDRDVGPDELAGWLPVSSAPGCHIVNSSACRSRGRLTSSWLLPS